MKNMNASKLCLLGVAGLLAIATTGCPATVQCNNDSNCPASFTCVNNFCLAIAPDLAITQTLYDGPPPSTQDFRTDDGGGGCPQGTKQCGVLQGNAPRCIPNDYCCTNLDCPADGQTCAANGECQCPVGQRACGTKCIVSDPNSGTACCTDDDCSSKVCSRQLYVCLPPACGDGVANGNETDIDCGGGFCDPCLDGRSCVKNVDCVSNYCNSTCNEPGFNCTM